MGQGRQWGAPLSGSDAGVRARERSERATRVRESGGCGSRPARAGPEVWAVRCWKRAGASVAARGRVGRAELREKKREKGWAGLVWAARV